MRLAAFIRQNLEIILQEWEDFAVTLPPIKDSNKMQLRDHAQMMLHVICDDLETFQCAQVSIDKSWGKAPPHSTFTAAESHAEERINSGLSIEEVMAEYRALRASVLRLWQSKFRQANEHVVQDMIRFNEAVDQSLTESIARYTCLQREAQNVFLAILGHDVRNPLGAISMGSQLLLQDDKLDLKHVNIAKVIRLSVDRANKIVSDLLDFSTTHLGMNIPVTLVQMDFQVECKAIVDELRLFYPKSDIRLEMESDLIVYWDRARIGQALSNLVANAIHHGSPGTAISVTVTKNDNAIQWVIQNQGKVISSEELRCLFNSHKQYSIKQSADGHLGLGLYVTHLIVEAHKGTIRVTSTANEGTIFTITLPRGHAPNT
ncbi:MAG: Signal transduction histidine kinase [Candidatus Nitrotoga sp. SPKER]|nr:MAG: Signal transduction histidine kinase [Candidatus Nitrotoga sp. SPKER]